MPVSGIDVHDRAVSAAGPAAFAAVERGLDLEPGVQAGAQLPGCGPPRDLADGDRAGRVAADPDVAVGDQQVLRAGLHEVRREIEHLGLELASAMKRHARLVTVLSEQIDCLSNGRRRLVLDFR
jgi:hypothetical protein